jgi:hypothetical protein
MSTIPLSQVITQGGIYWNNFFNGRILSGEDLSQEQADNLEGRRRLGRARGEGVAYGLEVAQTLSNSLGSTTVTIRPGLAINRLGQTLTLADETEVSLAPPASNSTQTPSGFGECQPKQPGVYVAGAGIYLLTIAPASGSDGRAPTSGLGNIAATCNTRYTVEGIQFRLLSLNSALTAELSDPDHLRNRLAYRCFGAGDAKVSGFIANPFGPIVEGYGLIDDLRSVCLTDCDVPLAAIYWTATGIQFIDLWAVRRRLTRPAAAQDWRLLTSDRRVSEAEARFLQFEAQIEEIRANDQGLASIQATQRFRYLPAAGIIPITNFGSAGGFDYQQFFSGRTLRGPVFVEGAQVEHMVRESMSYTPIDLDSDVMIWLYLVRENMQGIDTGRQTPAQAHLAFASGYIPPQGAARFNVARWNYSNYTIL